MPTGESQVQNLSQLMGRLSWSYVKLEEDVGQVT